MGEMNDFSIVRLIYLQRHAEGILQLLVSLIHDKNFPGIHCIENITTHLPDT